SFLLYFLCLPHPPASTLFPYTTLFRSHGVRHLRRRQDFAALLSQAVSVRRRSYHDAGEIFERRRTQSAVTRACFEERRQLSHPRSEEHTSELQSRVDLVCRLLLEKKK